MPIPVRQVSLFDTVTDNDRKDTRNDANVCNASHVNGHGRHVDGMHNWNYYSAANEMIKACAPCDTVN
jgi:hypothetical protein